MGSVEAIGGSSVVLFAVEVFSGEGELVLSGLVPQFLHPLQSLRNQRGEAVGANFGKIDLQPITNAG